MQGIPIDYDRIFRFLFDRSNVRGEIVQLSATWKAAQENHQYPENVKKILGEAMVATALLASTIKFDGSITMQIQGDGCMKLLVVRCSNDFLMRGTARWEGEVPDASLVELFGNGYLTITIDMGPGKDDYQGIVALGQSGLAEALQEYFRQSEQVDTWVRLQSSEDVASGMLLQALPGTPVVDEDLWGRVLHLASTVTDEELANLPVKNILQRLFSEETIRLFDPSPVCFRCSCSRRGIEDVLRTLGQDEVQDILSEQGQVSVTCEYCGREYSFDQVDVEQLFSAADPLHAPRTSH